LRCTGQAVSRTQYPALFASIGIIFGSGDGSTTFNVPNLPALAVSVGYVIRYA
jgi:microcystin-dependent protein